MKRRVQVDEDYRIDAYADRLSIPDRAAVDRLNATWWPFVTSFGNTLAVREYGDPQGFPVLFFHGTGAHLHATGLHEPGLHYGFRIIVPTRPGCADSTFWQSTHLQYAQMMRELLAHMEIDQAAFMGISGGGPTLMAAALHMPDIATAIVPLACASPIYQDPDMLGELGSSDRLFARLGARMSLRTFTPVYGTLGVMFRSLRSPKTFAKVFAGSLAKPDQELFADPDFSYLIMRDFQELFKHGSRGPAWDAQSVYLDWGYDFADIHDHTDVFQGTDDQFIPPVLTDYYLDHLDDVTLVTMPGMGHMGHMAYGYRTLHDLQQILARRTSQPPA